MRPIRLSVCICTFRRPHLLGELLEALAAQEAAPPIEVVIVDNDPDASATPAIESFRCRHPALALRSFHEPVQNIARARNRAVAEARGEWLALIDDDERPGRRWLARLVDAA